MGVGSKDICEVDFYADGRTVSRPYNRESVSAQGQQIGWPLLINVVKGFHRDARGYMVKCTTPTCAACPYTVFADCGKIALFHKRYV